MDVVVDVTKDLLADVTMDAETILVSGLFYFSYSAVTEVALAEVAVTMIAAYGLLFFYSAVAVMDLDGTTMDVEITVDVAATTIAAKTQCVTGNSCHTFIM